MKTCRQYTGLYKRNETYFCPMVEIAGGELSTMLLVFSKLILAYYTKYIQTYTGPYKRISQLF